jgi:hypothetical protein
MEQRFLIRYTEEINKETQRSKQKLHATKSTKTSYSYLVVNKFIYLKIILDSMTFAYSFYYLFDILLKMLKDFK